MCFHTLGGGGPGGVEKIHTFHFFFFEGFPRITPRIVAYIEEYILNY